MNEIKEQTKLYWDHCRNNMQSSTWIIVNWILQILECWCHIKYKGARYSLRCKVCNIWLVCYLESKLFCMVCYWFSRTNLVLITSSIYWPASSLLTPLSCSRGVEIWDAVLATYSSKELQYCTVYSMSSRYSVLYLLPNCMRCFMYSVQHSNALYYCLSRQYVVLAVLYVVQYCFMSCYCTVFTVLYVLLYCTKFSL